MVDGLVRENFEKKKKKNSLNLKENSPESNTGVEGMVGKILQGPYL
jgi:hypothetical protein